MSIREIARQFGHSRQKIREVLKNPEPRPYQRSKSHQPKLTLAFQHQIDAILQKDETAPRKQRHTAVAIHRRLVDDGYCGGYDQVRRYIQRKRGGQRETFIPLSHDPGQRAEADFGKIYVDFPDGRRQVSVLVMAWAYSNCTFAIALPNERIEAILHGTVKAFDFFRCVPKELWWDNPKTVAETILNGRKRVINDKYLSLASHYNFEPLFCLPARGNEKPHVENRVKYLQRNWATPIPRVANLDELNRHLLARCVNDRQRIVAGRKESIAERFGHDGRHALPLPPVPFDPAVSHEREVDKYQTVAFDTCRYSVPRRYAFRKAKVKAYVDHVEVVIDGRVVACHDRSYESHAHVLDPLHFLETLERKPACLDHTSVYRNWKLPAEFGDLREHLENRHGRLPGARQYIRVLQLLATHPVARVRRALRQCQVEGVVTAERVAFRCERRVERDQESDARTFEREVVVHSIPIVQVPVPNLKKFDSLLSQGGDDHDGARPATVTEGELETASIAHHARGVCEAGS